MKVDGVFGGPTVSLHSKVVDRVVFATPRVLPEFDDRPAPVYPSTGELGLRAVVIEGPAPVMLKEAAAK